MDKKSLPCFDCIKSRYKEARKGYADIVNELLLEGILTSNCSLLKSWIHSIIEQNFMSKDWSIIFHDYFSKDLLP